MNIDELHCLIGIDLLKVVEQFDERLRDMAESPQVFLNSEEETKPLAERVAKVLHVYADILDNWNTPKHEELCEQSESAEKALEDAITVFEEAFTAEDE